MGELTALKKAITDSTLLAQQGAYEEALNVLKDAISEIENSDSADSVLILLCHAAIISFGGGDITAAENCIRANFEKFPDDPFSLYLMAEVLERQAEYTRARLFASRSLDVALKCNSTHSKAILEIIKQRWPDLKARSSGNGEIRSISN